MSLQAVVLVLLFLSSTATADKPNILPIQPPEFDFFSKQVVCKGIPIKAHKDVDDAALREPTHRHCQYRSRSCRPSEAKPR
jgi:hypothetical protein